MTTCSALLALLPSSALGEAPVQQNQTAAVASSPSPTATPSLFLSCSSDCFDAYLRQNLSYFDLSRDPYRADLVLVVVRQPAGNGGERFTVSLTQQLIETVTPSHGALKPHHPPAPLSQRTQAAQAPPARSASQAFTVPAGTPAHAARRLLLQTSLRLLQEHLQGSPHEAAFELVLPPRSGAELSTLADPWDYWVFMPELGGEGEGGSGYYFTTAIGALTVRRITEPSKFRLRASYVRQLSSYLLEDGERISGDVFSWDTRALYAQSLGEHWALGAVVTGRASEYENLRAHAHGGPLLELNLYPYSENASKQVRFAYQAGAWANEYFEVNVQGLLREVRPYQALSLITDVNQPWGSVQWVGQINQFFDAPERYRVSTGALLSLRLFEGLAFSLEGDVSLVRDLVSLRARPVTDKELILWTVQQPTNYQFGAIAKLTYALGSTHNTIVNPRFARVDLDEE